MGKNNTDSKGSRREPFNQPIKIYGVASPEGMPASRQVLDDMRRGLRARRLGRSVDARVGNDIACKRVRAGLSVEQFARRMKMSAARLKNIEAGKERLSLSLIERIAAALGCCVSVEFA